MRAIPVSGPRSPSHRTSVPVKVTVACAPAVVGARGGAAAPRRRGVSLRPARGEGGRGFFSARAFQRCRRRAHHVERVDHDGVVGRRRVPATRHLDGQRVRTKRQARRREDLHLIVFVDAPLRLLFRRAHRQEQIDVRAEDVIDIDLRHSRPERPEADPAHLGAGETEGRACVGRPVERGGPVAPVPAPAAMEPVRRSGRAGRVGDGHVRVLETGRGRRRVGDRDRHR